jgi:hypothetical protein
MDAQSKPLAHCNMKAPGLAALAWLQLDNSAGSVVVVTDRCCEQTHVAVVARHALRSAVRNAPVCRELQAPKLPSVYMLWPVMKCWT